MGDWLVGLKKAAVESRQGATEAQLAAAEQAVGLPMPVELRSLYAQMDGGSFEPDVALYRLFKTADSAGVAEETRAGLAGLPGNRVWRFGLRGGADHLFASLRSVARPAAMAPSDPAAPPTEVWVFGRKNTDTGELELFKTLPALLWKLIPPVESEDFGENTYIRAINAVQEAIQEIERQPPKRAAPKKAPKAKAKPKAAKKSTAKPAAKKKSAPAKKRKR